MRAQRPVTQTMKIFDVKNQLSSLVNEVYPKETRVLVETSGVPLPGQPTRLHQDSPLPAVPNLFSI